MRVDMIRTSLAFLCIVTALALIAYPVCGLSLPETPGSPQMYFPMNMFMGADQANSAQTSGAASAVTSKPNYSFFNAALGMLPAGDASTDGQMNAIMQMHQGYQPSYAMPKTTSSWMSRYTQPSAINGQSNPALSSYDTFVKFSPNMTNIFES